ncbi:MAG: co-chaperone GroES [Deltaproteobacteria bacterium]|nr:MAG: co-chaperone GroES [Deltaproteobacteria bacterium]
MKVRPLQNRVLVKRRVKEERTKSGIYIPDTAKEKENEGLVVAVGPGKRLEDGTLRPVGVKEGDIVLFEKYAGTEIKIDGVEHVILRDDDILGIVDR